MRGLRLWKGAVGLLLRRMDDVGKLDRVLDKEHWDIVPNQVPVAFFRVKLYREAAYVSREVCRTFASGDGRKADEDRGFLARTLEQIGSSNVGEGLVILEMAMRAVAASMHDPLRNTLMVEVKDLFPEMEILKGGGSPLADLE